MALDLNKNDNLKYSKTLENFSHLLVKQGLHWEGKKY
jgi:hypothetical protein